MKKHLWLIPAAALFALSANAQETKKADKPADTTKKVAPTTPPTPPKPTVADKTKSSKKIDGLFTLYKDTVTGSLQLYIKKDQLGKDYIYQSFSMGGPTRLFLNQNMIRNTKLFQMMI